MAEFWSDVPTSTPYPRGAGYATGSALNSFVRSFIAQRMYAAEAERRKREEALQRLSVIGKFGPGAVRQAAPGLGFPEIGNIPVQPQERGAEILNQMLAGQGRKLEDLSDAELMALETVNPQLGQDIRERRRMREAWDRFGEMGGVGSEPPSDLTPPSMGGRAPAAIAPPAASMGALGGGRTTKKVTRGISATGYPTISAEETTAPESMEERTTREVEELRPQLEAQVREQMAAGRFAMPDIAKRGGVSPDDWVAAIVNSELQNRFPTREIKGLKRSDLVTQAQKTLQQRSADERAERAEEALTQGWARIDALMQRMTQEAKRGNQAAEQRDKAMAIQGLQSHINSLRFNLAQRMTLLRSLFPESAETVDKDEYVQGWQKDLAEAQDRMNQLSGVKARSPGVSPTIPVPPAWLKRKDGAARQPAKRPTQSQADLEDAGFTP